MAGENRQDAYAYLMDLATQQGYVTFDTIFEVTERWQLPMSDVDWLSNSIAIRGVIVYEKPPVKTHKPESNPVKIHKPESEKYRDYAQGDYEEVFRKVVTIEPSLTPFITEIKSIRPPQYREFTRLIYQAKEGNVHARNRIVEMHLRMAVRVGLQRAEQYEENLVDCIGEACVGLVSAIDRYDPKTSGPFSSYASLWMLQNISREQATKRPDVYYPVHKKEQYFIMFPILREHGCASCEELWKCNKARDYVKKRLKCSDDQIEDVILQMIPFISIDTVIESVVREQKENRNGSRRGFCRVWFDRITSADDLVENCEQEHMQEAVKSAMDALTERERRVLEERYGFNDGEEKTLGEVGTLLGVTRERIRQIEAKAIKKLRYSVRLKEFAEYYSSNRNVNSHINNKEPEWKRRMQAILEKNTIKGFK